jgi:hypothetical protein
LANDEIENLNTLKDDQNLLMENNINSKNREIEELNLKIIDNNNDYEK